MYQDTILKFNNLKQAHTDTIYNISEKKYIVRFDVRENFQFITILISKKCKWVKSSKNI